MQTVQSRWSRAIVVGASSGIGEALARQLATSGVQVALIARRAERLQAIAAEVNSAAVRDLTFPLVHDVRHTSAAPAVFQEAVTRLGGLDLVIYAAGIMPPAAPGEYPTADDIQTIDVNVSGAVAWLNEAAGRFSRARSGTIIGISSVAGDRGRQGNLVYNAGKAALNTYLEGLRARLARQGVTVLTAKPGYVQTALLTGPVLPRLIPIISAEEAASQILTAALAGRRVVYVPRWWRFIMAAVRAIPAPIFERLRL